MPADQLKRALAVLSCRSLLNDLPYETRKFFDLCTPELLELGFQLDGFYLMKPKPENYYGALFINESGTTVASLTHILDNFFWF